ncbi:hypothetical protein ACEWY4_016182 [Coilia grayii]|uniref:Uncharacterized protein n=1 Tax=Coilia grayii TaxID=363190 RepID=A0ABD1JKN5_9TELE
MRLFVYIGLLCRNAVGNKFLAVLLQHVGTDKAINISTQQLYQRDGDSREIWNLLRAQSKSKLSQLTTSPSLLKLMDEQQECRRLAEEKDRNTLQRSRVTLMFKASQFNQHRTALLIASNPLQIANNPAMDISSPSKYLPTYAPPLAQVTAHLPTSA